MKRILLLFFCLCLWLGFGSRALLAQEDNNPKGSIGNDQSEALPVPKHLGITARVIRIVGIPETEVVSGPLKTLRRKLDKNEAKEKALRIAQINGRFYWSSQDNRELFHWIENNMFDCFYAEDLYGYIRAFRDKGKMVYMESFIGLEIENTTRFGELMLINLAPLSD